MKVKESCVMIGHPQEENSKAGELNGSNQTSEIEHKA
jgi:hypothetical protein